MRKIVIYIFMLFLIFIAGNSIDVIADDKIQNDTQPKNTVGAIPNIKFDEYKYNFGKIYSGEKVTHKFKFKNLGNGELIIDKVKSSCGCTAALSSKKNLKKNEEGEIEVRFNSGKYVGKITKSIFVHSNDPVNPKVKLAIEVKIIEEVSVNPRRINFGIVRMGGSCSQNIEIKTLPESDIKILKVETSFPYIKLTEKNKNESVCNYDVMLRGMEEFGKFNGFIFVHTDSKKKPRIDVPFNGEVIGDITYYPSRLSFGTVKKNREAKKSVIVTLVDKNVKIEKIEIEPPFMTYDIAPLNDDSQVISVHLRQGEFSGKVNGNLMIYSNSSIQPAIYIPILATINN
ncbi:MAG: DUF1573 domain-containing protein [Candidatus Kuenenia sp.]|nr:DUF1573 domain-containing protein [Candidatus Kuenenia hertensis]